MQYLLNENDVVRHTCSALVRERWSIARAATTKDRGIDIVADRDGSRLYVEAKGVTSSDETSRRYGSLQTSSQIFIQVAAALLKTAELRDTDPEAEVVIAVPEHPAMRRRLGGINSVLRDARIGVLWVDADGGVAGWNTTAVPSTDRR